MTNFFTRLFLGESGSIATQGVVDTAKKSLELIDETFNTDQEKQEAKKIIIEQLIRAHESTGNDGNAPARFWFLQQITNFTFTLCILTIIAKLCSRSDIVDTIMDAGEIYHIGWAFVVAVGFFFLADITHIAGAKFGKK